MFLFMLRPAQRYSIPLLAFAVFAACLLAAACGPTAVRLKLDRGRFDEMPDKHNVPGIAEPMAVSELQLTPCHFRVRPARSKSFP